VAEHHEGVGFLSRDLIAGFAAFAVWVEQPTMNAHRVEGPGSLVKVVDVFG
jgi:hypothetical protein